MHIQVLALYDPIQRAMATSTPIPNYHQKALNPPKGMAIPLYQNLITIIIHIT